MEGLRTFKAPLKQELVLNEAPNDREVPDVTVGDREAMIQLSSDREEVEEVQ